MISTDLDRNSRIIERNNNSSTSLSNVMTKVTTGGGTGHHNPHHQHHITNGLLPSLASRTSAFTSTVAGSAAAAAGPHIPHPPHPILNPLLAFSQFADPAAWTQFATSAAVASSGRSNNSSSTGHTFHSNQHSAPAFPTHRSYFAGLFPGANGPGGGTNSPNISHNHPAAAVSSALGQVLAPPPPNPHHSHSLPHTQTLTESAWTAHLTSQLASIISNHSNHHSTINHLQSTRSSGGLSTNSGTGNDHNSRNESPRPNSQSPVDVTDTGSPGLQGSQPPHETTPSPTGTAGSSNAATTSASPEPIPLINRSRTPSAFRRTTTTGSANSTSMVSSGSD